MFSVEFREESPPVSVAMSFGLMDFDTEMLPAVNFTVVLTLSDAVDGREYEGLLFDTMGTGITFTVSPVSDEDPFTITYTLQGSNNYTDYQNVCNFVPLAVMWCQDCVC